MNLKLSQVLKVLEDLGIKFELTPGRILKVKM